MNSKKSKSANEKKPSSAKKDKDPRQSTTTSAPPAPPPSEPPARRTIDAPDAITDKPPKAKGKKSEMVTVTIPHAFNLLVGSGETGTSQMFTYGPGITEIPREHAEHEYARAHGVEIQE